MRLKLKIRRYLSRRVRLGAKYQVRLPVLLLCLLAPIVILIVILTSSDPVVASTTTTVLDLNLDGSLLTKEELADFPISKRSIGSQIDQVFHEGCLEVADHPDGKVNLNAALIVLSRNQELPGVIKSMKSLERHFNQWFHYPWVFLNDEDHTEKFKQEVRKHTSSKISFGTIPQSQWEFPNDLDKDYEEHIINQGDRGIMYGQLKSYHKMCRFYSKYFFKHDLLKDLEWYWRVEPDVQFYCDITYDPFKELQARNKKYGFTVMIKELIDTVPNLFRYTKTFIREYGINSGDLWRLFIKDLDFYEGKNKDLYRGVESVSELVSEIQKDLVFERVAQSETSEVSDKLLKQFVKRSQQKSLPKVKMDSFELQEYNLCHFWSNFEIARTDLFNNELYDQYLEFLEKSGGFYKERWGDLPVHSLLVGMFLNLTDVHYFRDIGYKHSTLGHCPQNAPGKQLPYRLGSNAAEDYKPYRPDTPRENGVGCRCKCPRKFEEIENAGGSCMGQWINLTQRASSSTNQKLDINKIKMLLLDKLDLHLKRGGTLEKWKLSREEIKELTKEKI